MVHGTLGVVFQSPVATRQKNWQPNWTATNLDQTLVAGPGGCVIHLVAVALAQEKIKNRLQPVQVLAKNDVLTMYCTGSVHITTIKSTYVGGGDGDRMHACRRAGVGGGWWSRACIHAGGQASVLVVRGSSLSLLSPSPLPFVCHCRCHCLSSSSLSVFFIVCLLRCHLSAWPHPRQQHGSTAALAGCVASSLSLSVCVVSSLAGWPCHRLSSLLLSVCMASSSLSMWQCSSTGWLGGLVVVIVVVVVVVVVVCLLHCCLSHGLIVISLVGCMAPLSSHGCCHCLRHG